jgi:ribosomal protein S18 acetylase RimI-like enzyme
MEIRPISAEDRAHVRQVLRQRWGDDLVVAHGEALYPAEHPGFVAGEWEGLVTYRIDGDACEVLTIDAFAPGHGVGSALLDAVVGVARDAGCTRVWLVTTNDNLRARAWYERRGFRLVRVDEGAVDRARALKPIPATNAENGLPIRDELELERRLDAPA